MKNYLRICLSILISTTLTAQETTKQKVSVGFAFARIGGFSLASTPVLYTHQISQVKGLHYSVGVTQHLGYGARTFEINKQNSLIDDLSNYSINILAGVEYVKYKFILGFNIDLLGATVGTRSYKTVGKDPIYSIFPQAVNIFAVSGSTNNQLYLGYQFTDAITLKAGVCFYSTNLQYSNQNINATTTNNKATLPFAMLQYTLWQK